MELKRTKETPNKTAILDNKPSDPFGLLCSMSQSVPNVNNTSTTTPHNKKHRSIPNGVIPDISKTNPIQSNKKQTHPTKHVIVTPIAGVLSVKSNKKQKHPTKHVRFEIAEENQDNQKQNANTKAKPKNIEKPRNIEDMHITTTDLLVPKLHQNNITIKHETQYKSKTNELKISETNKSKEDNPHKKQHEHSKTQHKSQLNTSTIKTLHNNTSLNKIKANELQNAKSIKDSNTVLSTASHERYILTKQNIPQQISNIPMLDNSRTNDIQSDNRQNHHKKLSPEFLYFDSRLNKNINKTTITKDFLDKLARDNNDISDYEEPEISLSEENTTNYDTNNYTKKTQKDPNIPHLYYTLDSLLDDGKNMPEFRHIVYSDANELAKLAKNDTDDGDAESTASSIKNKIGNISGNKRSKIDKPHPKISNSKPTNVTSPQEQNKLPQSQCSDTNIVATSMSNHVKKPLKEYLGQYISSPERYIARNHISQLEDVFKSSRKTANQSRTRQTTLQNSRKTDTSSKNSLSTAPLLYSTTPRNIKTRQDKMDSQSKRTRPQLKFKYTQINSFDGSRKL